MVTGRIMNHYLRQKFWCLVSKFLCSKSVKIRPVCLEIQHVRVNLTILLLLNHVFQLLLSSLPLSQFYYLSHSFLLFLSKPQVIISQDLGGTWTLGRQRWGTSNTRKTRTKPPSQPKKGRIRREFPKVFPVRYLTGDTSDGGNHPRESDLGV